MDPLNYQTSEIAAVYDKYAEMLFRVAYTELLSKEDAEDTISEVFLKFIKRAPKFSDAEHEKAWFLRVTINQCHDMQRKRVVRSYTPLEEIAELPVSQKTDHFLLEEVLVLPEKFKIVLILHYFEELSIEEIASALRISKAAVKMRLVRGRESLRDRMER
ncbi:MAG TPA: sigma-70 family RNA polymerase sigma factor [Lachnospiraceae bacterium]|nr:sigma-70 family RNA polymerase sigma factor [uncultured Lachnoclostridium sp.]HAU86533.1 sigma-70 family RNA polymerase sigma factor [Lachnospiraceae bacterium]